MVGRRRESLPDRQLIELPTQNRIDRRSGRRDRILLVCRRRNDLCIPDAIKGGSDFLEHATIEYDYGRPASITKRVKARSDPGDGTTETRTMTYDGYGNLSSQTVHGAASTQTTNFYYDGDVDPGAAVWPAGTQNSFSIRVGVMDPAGGIVSSIPDPGTGAIVETASTYSDEPGSKVTLDVFGRPIESFVHDGTAWLKTSATVYDDVAFTPPVVTRWDFPDSSADPLSAIWSSVVSDGFGGTWKEIGETPVGFVGTFTYHDAYARTTRKSLPKECGDGSCSGNSGSTEPVASLTTVDAIGRPVRVETPYGFSAFDYTSGSIGGPWTSSLNSFDVVLEKNGKGDLIRRGMDGDRIAWVEECENTVSPGATGSDLGSCSSPPTTFYSYEGTGELSRIFDQAATNFTDADHYLQYQYDTLGRVVQIDDPALAGTGNSRTS